jgi:hypothetical protein
MPIATAFADNPVAGGADAIRWANLPEPAVAGIVWIVVDGWPILR